MLITILVVLLLLALAIYAVQNFVPLDSTLRGLIVVVLVVIAIIYIAQAAGIA